MKIASYDPVDMSLLLSDTTTVDLGNGICGKHADNVIVLQPQAEIGETLTQLAVFLEDNGGLNHSRFGKLKSSTAFTGITPGDARLSDFFIQVSGISDFSTIEQYSDHGLMLTASSPEYVWIDAEIGDEETTLGSTAVNIRFIFEYS